MPEGFDLLAKDWGPESLLGVLLLSIILGFLETRMSVKAREIILKSQIAEALEREKTAVKAAEKLQEAVVLQSRHLAELTEQGKMTVALLQGIQRAASYTPNATSLLGRHHRGET